MHHLVGAQGHHGAGRSSAQTSAEGCTGPWPLPAPPWWGCCCTRKTGRFPRAMSALCSMSVRKDGTVIASPCTVNPMVSKMSTISSRATSTPKKRLIQSASNGQRSWGWDRSCPRRSPRLPPRPRPAAPPARRRAAAAGMQFCGSSPFSKRPEASVRRPSFLAVVRTEAPLKQADSNTTVWVSSMMPLYSPPMTPATAAGFSSSQITSISGERVRSTPSRVTMLSPALALRTTMWFALDVLVSQRRAWAGRIPASHSL